MVRSGTLERPVDDSLDNSVRSDRRLFRLAEGTELLGEYKDAGYQEPRYLVRRSDAQVMQLPHLLYRVVGSLDGRGADEIAADLSAELGQELTGDQVAFLVDERLRSAGVVAPDDADPAPSTLPTKCDPLLALRYRARVVPATVSWRIAGVFRPLFSRPAWVGFLAAFLAVDLWILFGWDFRSQVAAGVEQLVHHPVLVLAGIALTLLSATFHECGHVTACRYGGGRPGDMGVGLYLVWPAFYSTVTDSYRLDRAGRLRTDLGGVYFNSLFMLGVGLLYLRTGQAWLLIALIGMHFETAWQFLPSIRLDGYYVLADLVGVPDLFSYMGPTLKSALPGRPTDPRVRGLRPWTRRIIVTWVALVVPTLLLYLVGALILLPRLLPVVWAGLIEYLHVVNAALRAGDMVTVTLGVWQLLLLLLPWVGTTLITVTTVKMLGRAARRRWGRGRQWVQPGTWAAARHGVALAGTGLLAAGLVLRVAQVALSTAPSSSEARIGASASAVLSGGASAAQAVGWSEGLVRDQLLAYDWLTRSLDRHGDAVMAGRELAVVACAVLVVCFLTVARIARCRPLVVAVPLAAAAAMGPVVTALATLSGALMGAAWAAVGATTLLPALRQRGGRHRSRQGRLLRRSSFMAGLVAMVIGVMTAPFLAVPIALGSGLLVVHRGRHADPLPFWRPLTGVAFAATVFASLTVPALLTTPAESALAGPAWQILAATAVLTVGAGIALRRLRQESLVLGSLVLLALLPVPGAARLVPLVVCVTLTFAALILQTIAREPVDRRPHPLLRGALAVPAFVLVVVGALLLPSFGL
jgi:putative peptide zinc metalloprotease protein